MATWRPTPPWSPPSPRASKPARDRRRAGRARLPHDPTIAEADAAGPGLRQPPAASRRVAARCCRRSCAPAKPTATARIGGGVRDQRRIRLGQPDRADACRPLPRRRGRRRAGQPAGQGRLRASPRSTTSTTPARRSRRSPGPPTGATCRRSARRLTEEEFAEAVPGGLQYRGDYLVPVGEALAQRYGDTLAGAGLRHRRPGQLARHRARLHHRRDDARHPRGSGAARRRQDVFTLRARAGARPARPTR